MPPLQRLPRSTSYTTHAILEHLRLQHAVLLLHLWVFQLYQYGHEARRWALVGSHGELDPGYPWRRGATTEQGQILAHGLVMENVTRGKCPFVCLLLNRRRIFSDLVSNLCPQTWFTEIWFTQNVAPLDYLYITELAAEATGFSFNHVALDMGYGIF